MTSTPVRIPNSRVRYMLCDSGLATIALRPEVGTPQIADRIDGARLGDWSVTEIVEAATRFSGAVVQAICYGSPAD